MRNHTCHAQPVCPSATPTAETLSDHASLALSIWPKLDGHNWPDQIRTVAHEHSLDRVQAARALGELINTKRARVVTT